MSLSLQLHHFWAHPRSRGENYVRREPMQPHQGSSPLTRGKPRNVRVGPGSRGLIHAHAGKTCTRRRRRTRLGGSSPLTRGKLLAWRISLFPYGLIPAHAGKTLFPFDERLAVGAHPRSRGENLHVVQNGVDITGSSPLTRGKLRVGLCRARELGLIPAHAGKTSQGRRSRPCCRAHPRSRGENNQPRSCCVLPGGSSPLTRGKPRRSSRSWSPPTAHPRSRGEN